MTPKELKNSILQLAIEGKLVKQRKEDDSAETLYAEIQKEKQKLIKQGKIKKEKELPEITDDEMPFEIPKSWKWVRFNNLCQTLTCGLAATPKYVDEKKGKPFLSAKNIKPYKMVLNDYKYIEKDLFNNLRKTCTPMNGDILLTRVGAGIGEAAIIDCDFNFAIYVSLTLIKLVNNKKIFNKYVLFWLNSPYGMLAAKKNTYGKDASQGNLNVKNVREYLFPLPPLQEQQRIVEKIEELMPLVDRYEVLYNRLNELNKEFPKKLKNAVLQKAIEGKLVKQIKSEGDAEDLYKEIQKEKQKLIKQGKVKKEKELPEITDDEVPFEIPKSWKWVRLGEIGSWGSGATPSKSEDKYFKNGNIPWLLTGDLNDGYINNSPQYITKLALEKTSVRLNPKGSVLIAMYGATIGKLGILNIEATTNQACCACQTFKGVYNKYLFYFLMAYKKRFTEKAEGGAQPNISKEKIVNTHFSLPPFEEQKRIVGKIEEILPNIEKLKKYGR